MHIRIKSVALAVAFVLVAVYGTPLLGCVRSTTQAACSVHCPMTLVIGGNETPCCALRAPLPASTTSASAQPVPVLTASFEHGQIQERAAQSHPTFPAALSASPPGHSQAWLCSFLI